MNIFAEIWQAIKNLFGVRSAQPPPTLPDPPIIPDWKPTPIGTISAQELMDIMWDKLENVGQENAVLKPGDNMADIFSKEDIKRFLSLDETNKLPYIPEKRDCDNFAGILFGEMEKLGAFAGGICETNTHRLNWFVDENKCFWFIEPQTDQIATDLENWQGTKITLLMS